MCFKTVEVLERCDRVSKSCITKYISLFVLRVTVVSRRDVLCCAVPVLCYVTSGRVYAISSILRLTVKFVYVLPLKPYSYPSDISMIMQRRQKVICRAESEKIKNWFIHTRNEILNQGETYK